MKVFISWSGKLSEQVAELLNTWLQNTIQGIDTWISREDIDKGSLWFLDISTELAESSVGVICLTSENLDAPWVLFEAGALAKGLSKNRVCPLLINLSPQDLIQPLGQFQATRPERNDMLQLIKTINKHCMQKRIPEQILKNNFDKWWDDFDKGFKKIISSHKPDKEFQKRTERDILEEILEISRAIQRNTPYITTFKLAGPLETPQPFNTIIPPVEVSKNVWSDSGILLDDTAASLYGLNMEAVEPVVHQAVVRPILSDSPSKKKSKRKKPDRKTDSETK